MRSIATWLHASGRSPTARRLTLGAAEIHRPLAVAVVGGLLVSTVVSLVVLPAMVVVVTFSDID